MTLAPSYKVVTSKKACCETDIIYHYKLLDANNQLPCISVNCEKHRYHITLTSLLT